MWYSILQPPSIFPVPASILCDNFFVFVFVTVIPRTELNMITSGDLSSRQPQQHSVSSLEDEARNYPRIIFMFNWQSSPVSGQTAARPCPSPGPSSRPAGSQTTFRIFSSEAFVITAEWHWQVDRFVGGVWSSPVEIVDWCWAAVGLEGEWKLSSQDLQSRGSRGLTDFEVSLT